MALFDISLDTANRFYAWGWKASLLGAALTLLGVLFVMWGTNVRDRDTQQKLSRVGVVESGLATRHVSAEQQAALINALKDVKLTVTLSRYNDPEASAYAKEVASALTDAGQTVEDGSVIIATGETLQGLLVEETADPRLINALIVARLVTQKMQSTRNDMLWTGKGLNAVVVGVKPNPF